MNKEEFIGKLQMCYFGERNAFEEIVSVYEKYNKQIEEYQKAVDKTMSEKMDLEHNWNELKKWLEEKEQNFRKDIYGAEFGYVIGTLLSVLSKMQELEEVSNE